MTQKPNLHQDWIDPEALQIVRSLQKKGFKTYLVGGCVRDLLLGIHPKDYDIATDAQPQDIRRAIPMSFIIGKRFRLVLVKRGQKQFEVSTFRRDGKSDEENFDPRTSDNIFGTPEEDARRRDFSINALLYDPINDELLDFVGGLDDLKAGVVRMIGEPDVRFQEDPIRILRALRLCHKIGFSLEQQMRQSIQSQAMLLQQSVLPRRREEFLKILRLDNPVPALLQAFDLGVLQAIAPELHRCFSECTPDDEWMMRLSRTDEIFIEESPLEILGHFVYHWVRSHLTANPDEHIKAEDLFHHPRLSELMRNELGLFKHEQDSVGRAIQLQPHLMSWRSAADRMSKRQLAVLVNDCFALSLILSATDHVLTENQILNWAQSYMNSEGLIDSVQSKRKKRTRRRRKKGPKEATDLNSEVV